MSQKWNCTGYPLPTSATLVKDRLVKHDEGIESAISCYGGDSNPTGGGTWGTDLVGAFWFNRTAEVGGSGDDRGGHLYGYRQTGASGTYEMRNLSIRGFVATEPNTSLISALTGSDVGWSVLDVSGATTSAYGAVAIRLLVEVKDATPGAGVKMEFRMKDTTTDAVTRAVYPQVANLTGQAIFDLELNANGQFEYKVEASGTTSFSYNVVRLGYFERV